MVKSSFSLNKTKFHPMSYNPENALIIQSDRTILLEVHSPRAEEAREAVRLPPGTS
ncbi:MAG: hypothetical protein QNJ65_18805 [Xenococcaceae cyanobacterium MO_234.B1]|nr:hypothetical protein [Xenococcaceae cyanobacterium MO_234.B1]